MIQTDEWNDPLRIATFSNMVTIFFLFSPFLRSYFVFCDVHPLPRSYLCTAPLGPPPHLAGRAACAYAQRPFHTRALHSTQLFYSIDERIFIGMFYGRPYVSYVERAYE